MRVTNYFSLSFLALVMASLCFQPASAQGLQGKALADSLIDALAKTKTDTDQIKIIIKAAKAVTQTDPALAMQYADSAMELSQLKNWQKGIGLAYINKSRISRRTSDMVPAIENATKAYEAFKSMNWNAAMGDASLEAAYAYELLGNYSKAIEYNFKALGDYEASGIDANLAGTYNNIGIDYYRLDDYPKAIDNYSKALEMHEKSNDKFGIASALDNMASVFKEQGEFKKVDEYNLKAIHLFEEIGDQPALGRIYINRGNFLQDQKNYDSALIYYRKAIGIAQKQGINRTIAFGNAGIGELCLNLAKDGPGDYIVPASLKLSKPVLLQNAYNYFSTALNLAKKGGDLSLKMRFTSSLSETESLRGNYRSALSFYEEATRYKDSIFNDENKQKIAALENERIIEVKDKEIQLLNKEKALQISEQEKKDAVARRNKNIQYFTIAGLGIVLLALGIIAFIQFKNNKQRKQANVLLLQQKEKVESTLNELKSTQAQLMYSEKMASLGELTAGIAHEIKNPLNFINNFSEVNGDLATELNLELLADKKAEALAIGKTIQENAKKIIQHSKRADAIVKGMLQHARPSTGQKEKVDINALADEYLRLSYQGMRAKDKSFHVQLRKEFGANIGKLELVPEEMGRVMLNLYNNAFYAVREKKKTAADSYEPVVSVSTKQIDSKIEILVKDNGIGIPEKIVDKIFQPFFTTKPAGQGTGLGLSLSFDMIKAFGGEIKVESKEREGSAFIVELPAKDIMVPKAFKS